MKATTSITKADISFGGDTTGQSLISFIRERGLESAIVTVDEDDADVFVFTLDL